MPTQYRVCPLYILGPSPSPLILSQVLSLPAAVLGVIVVGLVLRSQTLGGRLATLFVHAFIKMELPAYLAPIEALLQEPLLKQLDSLQHDFQVQSDCRVELESLKADELFGRRLNEGEMASCCLSGLWLLHGFLYESHEISQTIHAPNGAYWHAIMHRAEGDFWNSKYWYQRAGDHAVLEKLAKQFSGWSFDSFVDQCESGSNLDQLNEVARAEWAFLFHDCWSQALGTE